ncbi:MAG TPA: thrombospondin type 3 repeat-containing protein, partial [bacterium]|nr:thrombospondin type 3 repeat-containing protein [bacterium]
MKNILLIMSLLFVYGILLAADGTDWYHIKIGDEELVGKNKYESEYSSCDCPCTKGVYVDNVWNNPLYICYSETYPYAREADWSREAHGIAYFSEEYYFYSHADPAQGDGGIGLFPVNDFGSSSATLSLNTIVSDMVDKECFIDKFSDDEDNSHIGEITYDHEKDLLYVVVTPERGKEDALASYSYVDGEYVLKSCIKDFLDAALFFNRIDGLLYYSFNNSEIRGFDPNSYENDSWSDDMFSRKIMLKGSDSEEGSFQGGSFSPNGRFFFRIADKRNNENAGVYVYEIDGKHLDSSNEDNYWLDTETEVLDFNFIQHISFKYDGGDNEAFGELEGMDVYPEENGDIHVVYLRNEAYDDVYIFHFKAQVDSDSDGIEDIYDNCPYHSNKWQEDRDSNKVGDACDSDIDGDGVLNEEDNCPDISNPEQKDWNDDEIGDACQDSDNDGVLDIDDNCPSNANSDQADYDEDGVGDVCDNCP